MNKYRKFGKILSSKMNLIELYFNLTSSKESQKLYISIKGKEIYIFVSH